MTGYCYRTLALTCIIGSTGACSSDSDDKGAQASVSPTDASSHTAPTTAAPTHPAGGTTPPSDQTQTPAMPSSTPSEPEPAASSSDDADTTLAEDSTFTEDTSTDTQDIPSMSGLPSGDDAGTSAEEIDTSDTSSSQQDSTDAPPDGEPTASPGCGIPFAPEDVDLEETRGRPPRQTLRRTMEVSGVTREYLVTLPVDYDAQKPYALIFAFHGLGGDREQLRSYMNMERPADAEAILIYPGGLETDRGAGWALDADSDDLIFVDRLLEQYTQELCIDETRIFATGHSYGGCMSNSVGCFRGDVFRAIAPVAGCGPFGRNVTCRGQVAALVVHSPFDTVEDYSSGVQGCTRWLRANSCDENPECGCHWEDPPESTDQCLQTAQQPYTPDVPIEVTERDDRAPVFRQYTGCDEHYPVVTADYWRRERQQEGDPGERWHNPPPWAPELIWEFFSGLSPVQ